MAGPSRTLTLKLLADSSAFSRGVNAATGDLDTFGARIGRFAKNGAKLFAGLTVAAGAAAVAIGKNLFQAFEENEKSEKRLRNIVETMGLFEGRTEQVTQRLLDQAEALSALTGIDDDVIAGAQGILATFEAINATANTKGGVFDRATAAALDLQAAGFGNVESNATQLGKALQDPIKGLTALTRSGVTFSDAEKDVIRGLVESGRLLEAQDVLLDAIEKQVGGTAAASASASDLIRARFGLIRDELAEKLAPAFTTFSSFLLDTALPAVEDFVERFGPIILDAFERVSTFVTETLVPALEPLVTTFTEKVLPIIEELGAYLFDELIPALLETADTLVERFGPPIESIAAFVKETLLPAFQGLIDFFIETVVPTVSNILGPVLDGVASILDTIREKVAENRDSFQRWYEFFEPLIAFIRDTAAPVIGDILGYALGLIGEAVGEVIDLFANWIDLVGKVIDKVKELTRALRDSPFGTAIGDILDAVLPGRAMGGPVQAGRAYIVGERGPELMVPSRSGTIVPNHALGGSITININGTVLDPEGTARALRRVLTESDRRVGLAAVA